MHPEVAVRLQLGDGSLAKLDPCSGASVCVSVYDIFVHLPTPCSRYAADPRRSSRSPSDLRLNTTSRAGVAHAPPRVRDTGVQGAVDGDAGGTMVGSPRRDIGTARTIAGLRVTPLRRHQLLDAVCATLDQRSPLRMTFLNPDYARRALLDPRLKQDINSFDLVLVDGNGVRLMTPLFGFRVPERLDTDSVAPDLFRRSPGDTVASSCSGVPRRWRSRRAKGLRGVS
ncbi:MAG: hypothetical protein R2734_01355 [Nocardioides sp.]